MADELNTEEIGEAIHGGGRFNHLLLVVVIVLAIIVGVTLVHSLWGAGAGVTSQTATRKFDEDDAGRDKARVNELASYAEASPAPLAPVLSLPHVMVVPKQSPAPTTPKQLSPYEQWRRDEFLRAMMAAPMVKSFHDQSTIELTQAGTSGSVARSPANGTVRPPASPYTVIAGSVIPAVLVNGIDSDLPGPIVAQVSQNVFDSATGKSLLIPQGSRLIGDYSTAILYGQQRVRVEFQRLIFPDTSSMDLPHAPGVDQAGYAGVSDQTNNHNLATFGTAAVMALISAGQTVGQMAAFNNTPATYGPYGYQTSNQWELATQSAGAGASSQLGNVGAQTISRGLNRAPTLSVRPGYEFNVMLIADLIFPGPFKG